MQYKVWCESCRKYSVQHITEHRACPQCGGNLTELVKVGKQAQREALRGLVDKVTRGGGVHGNPYCVDEVRAALWALEMDF